MLFLENCKGDTCTHLGVLKKGKYLLSKNGAFKFILQDNGNLEILCKNKLLWASDTISENVDFMYFKKNGKLVLYGKDETDLWSRPTEESKRLPKKLILQDDGNLVLVDEFGTVIWESGTNGICDQGLENYLYVCKLLGERKYNRYLWCSQRVYG